MSSESQATTVGSRFGERDAACHRIRSFLEHGAPWDACDAFRDATTASTPVDAELLYWGALAHARAGANGEAHALLDRAQAAPDASTRLADILSLRGRLWKDLLHGARDAADVRRIAGRARAEYLAAYKLGHDPFPGINAATLSLLMGDRIAATNLAREVLANLAQAKAPSTLWDEATAGEAHLLLDEFDEARRHYVLAHAIAGDNAGSVASMRRQLALLSAVVPEAAALIALLRVPDVVAFAGHMIDARDRAEPRFPASLAPEVETAIGTWLTARHRPVAFTSAASGADLIFIERALAVGAEVNVVLPFDRADFVRVSVVPGGDEWVTRFDRSLARASRVIMATTEGYLGDEALFEHAAMLLEGLAILRAAQLQTSPLMLCVLDPTARGQTGGTLGSFGRWQRLVGAPEVIDLHALRMRLRGDRGAVAEAAAGIPLRGSPRGAGDAAEESASHGDDATAGNGAATAHTPHGSASASSKSPSRIGGQRTLKTLLFADFAGYSRLHDDVVPRFQDLFWKTAAAQIDASAARPLLANTWGDALYVVFDSPQDGAEFALGMLQRMQGGDWAAAGFAESARLRVALNAGPVFCGFDPVLGRDNYFGSTVTRTARIEPVTAPGTVYASETFAALLAVTGGRDYVLEYIGRRELAKGYGESRIYRLARR